MLELYIAFGICRYHTSGCCVTIATQQPDVRYINVKLTEIQLTAIQYDTVSDDNYFTFVLLCKDIYFRSLCPKNTTIG